MKDKPRILISAMVCVLGLSACGPQVSFNAGFKESPVDIVFGNQHPPSPPPAPPPPPSQNLFANFPAALAPPPPLLSDLRPVPEPSPLICPVAGPLAFPELPATGTPTKPPAAANYLYHYQGTVTPASTGKAQSLPNIGVRTIDQVATNTDGSYTFRVTEIYNDFLTTYNYHAVLTSPASSVPGGVNNPPVQPPTETPGLYLSHMDVKTIHSSSTAGTMSLTPIPEVLLMPYPAQPTLQFEAAGTDGTTGTSMEINPGTIVKQERVDACGTVLDSWRVEIIGRFVNAAGGPNGETDFDLTSWYATQYGGFPIAYHLVQTAADLSTGEKFAYDFTGTINVKPQPPG